MPRVTMKSTHPGADDGINVREYEAGKTYEMHDDLANVFIKEDWGVRAPDTATAVTALATDRRDSNGRAVGAAAPPRTSTPKPAAIKPPKSPTSKPSKKTAAAKPPQAPKPDTTPAPTAGAAAPK